ncbi:gamma-glutamyltranspeptidase / glutathione hydrolase [Cyclobacterium lianum]|uniref:Glutathione hydrolase proenzyme n=1 Tax=Cyclobacterium lianum TaxID=388280 RepID=A0A1M7N8X4_9BACT|nr:gamma-glutamyltransferase [Cyclobacterium lianum]SHN00088.1 gamma-glutamyltranspeptidase / glutathione hydrolase [Cyclobacterium lianum]
MKKSILISLVLFGMIPHLSAQAQIRSTGKSFATRSETIAKNGMAATSHPLATETALEVLRNGGNAVDAAIAANAVLGLVEPTGNGIGGDIFAIVWDEASQKLHAINGSGRSPKSLDIDYFQEKGFNVIPYLGPLPVSVPGCVDGWYTLHERFGSVPMKDLLQPAIDYAIEGFPVSEIIAARWAREVPRRIQYPGFRETFTFDGQAPKKGEIFKNPDLANTLSMIAAGGRDAFYKGEIARTIAAYMDENGGFLSYEDLAEHRSEWIEPVSTNYRGYDIWELPPNGQGIAALQILNILEGFDLSAMGFGSADYIHTFTEAKKLAYEDRAKYYADMDFNDIPVEELISKEYAERRRSLIDPNAAATTLDAGELNQGSTIYLTTADKEGNMVSLIQSNYGGMGSGMVPTGLGFGLHNRGQMFNVRDSGHFNAFEPGKRPFHTIIPAFITRDGKPFMSFGLMGGAIQPQGHAQIVINMIDFGMNVQEAGDAPRINHTGSSEPTGSVMEDGGTLYLEYGIDYEEIRSLIKLGHDVKYGRPDGFGGYQGIMYDYENKVYYGASESRKDGYAGGF